MVESVGKNEDVQEETRSVQQPAPGMFCGRASQDVETLVWCVGGEEQGNQVDLCRRSLGHLVCCDSIKVAGLPSQQWHDLTIFGMEARGSRPVPPPPLKTFPAKPSLNGKYFGRLANSLHPTKTNQTPPPTLAASGLACNHAVCLATLVRSLIIRWKSERLFFLVVGARPKHPDEQA